MSNKKVAPQLPKGFKAISGLGSTWDFEKEPCIEGKIVTFGEVQSRYKDPETKKFKMQKNCTIELKDKSTRTVWESAALRSLFDQKEGAQVAIVFLGRKKLEGRKEPMKNFLVGVK